MDISSLVILLLLFCGAHTQEECSSKCAQRFTDEKELDACKNGCRLAIVFNFAIGGEPASVNAKCRDGCAKSFATDAANSNACAFGCDSQPQMASGKVEVSISNKDPTFEVAQGAMNNVFSRFANAFPSFENSETSSEERNEDWMDPFGSMRRDMQSEMARFRQLAHRLLSSNGGALTAERPVGHGINAFEGPSVSNEDRDGATIIEVAPVPFDSSRLLGHQGENPMPNEEPSWLTRMAIRMRKLSALSQWLVVAALLLCLVSMLSITFALIKQIRLQRYQNLRNAHVILPSTFGEPLPAKKIPLESPSAAMDYPLIHDSPPPAYDQLSVHKEKPTDPPAQP